MVHIRSVVVCLIIAMGTIALTMGVSGCGSGKSAAPPTSNVSVSVSSSAQNFEQGQQGNLTFTASVTNDSTNAGVTWAALTCVPSGIQCGSLMTTGLNATYTPPSTVSTALSVTVTATSVKDPTQSGTVKITVTPSPAIAASAASSTATINSAYSLSLVNGGTPPYQLQISPAPAGASEPGRGAPRSVSRRIKSATTSTCSSLPSWLTFDPNTGTIMGAGASGTIPTTATDFDCSLQVTDKIGITSPAVAVTITVPVMIVSTSLPGTEQTASYTAPLTAAGGSGAYTAWSVSSGRLPTGLTIGSDGTISGTVATSASSQTFSVQVTDSNNATGVSQLALSVVPQLGVTAPSASGLIAGIGSAYSLPLQPNANTGIGPFMWSGSGLPSWLTISSGGVLSATGAVPGTAITSQFSVQVKDSANVTKMLPLTVTVPIKVTTVSLPNAEQTGTYAATLAAEGGSGTYSSWSVISPGSLPTGLTLASNGAISGTVGASATSQSFTAQVTDSGGATGSQQYTISIAPQVAIATPTPATLTATIGNAYNVTLNTATGTGVGPFTWSIASGSSLPSWLNFSSGGVLSVASTVPISATTSQFTVQVKDSENITSSVPLTVAVPIKVTTVSLPNAEQTGTYAATLAAEGGSGTYSSWSVISPGSLPTGLTLASNGAISGTVGASATSQSFTAQVTDSGGATGSQQYTISITPQVAITQPSAASLVATIGSAYNLSLQTTTGTGVGPFIWSLASGSALPSWLTLSSGGVLSVAGTVPTSATSSQFTVQVKDAENITRALPLAISVPIAVTTASLPIAEQTATYPSTTLTAIGGTGTYSSWTVSMGSLPAGLTLGVNGALTGTVSANATTQMFTVQVTDSNNATGSQTYTLTIDTQVAVVTPPAASLIAAIGASYNLTLQTTAGTGVGPFTWTLASGSTLPSWLNLTSSGVLSASSAVPGTATTSQFTVQVKDANNITATLPLTVSVPIVITTPSLPSTEQTASYNVPLIAEGGSGSYASWSVTAGTLPNGLSIGSNGSISGTLGSSASSQTFSVQVTDSKSALGNQTYTLSVAPQLAIATPSTASLIAAIGSTYNLTLQTGTGTGVGPFTWSVATGSTLPAWLTLTSGGVLSSSSGVPATAVSPQFTVQVKDANNISASLPLTVSVPISIVTASLSSGEVSTAYNSGAFVAQGGTRNYTWSATGLPTWASIDSTTGAITGNPTQGSSNVVVKATDSLNAFATEPLTLTIYPALAVSSAPLPAATINVPYSQTLAATGGVTPYTNWQLSGNGTLPAGLSLDKGTGVISGTPGCPQSALPSTSNFSITVQDSLNITSAAQAFSVTADAPALAITTTSIPVAAAGVLYSQQLQSTGGTSVCGGTITWSVISGTLPGWLSLSSNGILSGTPGTGDVGAPITVTVQATDGVDTPATEMLTISFGAVYNVSGQITLVNGGGPLQGVKVNVGSNFTATTDSSGNFTIANVPNGTYSVTPVFSGAPSSVFYPGSADVTEANGNFSVTVSGSNLADINFTSALGYTVSGSVTYGGKYKNLGQIFVTLTNMSCGGCAPLGTSISSLAVGKFTIQGVEPGTYTLQAWDDYGDYGLLNQFDPSGAASSAVTVSSATGDVSNLAVVLKDPAAAGVFVGGNPPKPLYANVKAFPIESGAVISYQPIKVNNIEQAVVYNLQWTSTIDNSTCISSPDGGLTIDVATGTGNPVVAGSGRTVILDGANPQSLVAVGQADFTDGTTVLFCMNGLSPTPSGSFTQSQWSFSTVTIGAPGGGAGTNTLSGNVTIPNTVSLSGPLYAGCYDQNTGNIYASTNESPINGDNAYSVAGIPTNAKCSPFGIVDQDDNGFVTPANTTSYLPTGGSSSGDLYNITSDVQPVTITANTSQNIDLTPDAVNSAIFLTTQHIQIAGQPDSYNLNFDVRALMELPVSVTLLSGPNLIAPMDFSVCSTCGNQSEFNVSLSTNGVRPQVGDTYNLLVSYQDAGVTPEVLTVSVTGVVDAFATGLMPTMTAGSDTPTFSWTYPTNAANYLYQFRLSDSTGNQVWQIPGSGSYLDGFTSTVASVPWSTTTDPTGASNPPSVSSLSPGSTYSWTLSTQDNNGNSAQVQASFTAP